MVISNTEWSCDHCGKTKSQGVEYFKKIKMNKYSHFEIWCVTCWVQVDPLGEFKELAEMGIIEKESLYY